jgi:hypothetical protein
MSYLVIFSHVSYVWNELLPLLIWMIERVLRVLFFTWETTFTWSSKKLSIVTLSTYKVKYVATTSRICHSIWLRRLLKKLWMPQEKPTEIYMDNSSVIALAKNPIFHNRSKHINTRFHYLWDCITNKEVKVKDVKTQDQVADIFTKPLKNHIFIKMRNMLEVMKKSSLKGDVESKLISKN